MDLRQILVDYITQVGTTESSRQFIDPRKGKAVTRITVDNWKHGRAAPPVWAIQQVIDLSNKRIDDFDGVLPWEGEKLRICVPCVRGVNAKLVKILNYLQYRHKGKVAIDFEENTLVDISRDRLAHRFLTSKAEWLLFIDDDMVPPIGDYAQMRNWGITVPSQFGSFDIIQRLVTRKKTLVSGLYFDRFGKGIAHYYEAINNEREALWAKGAPYDKVKPTKACGAGCLLINRVVFEAIKTEVEDLKMLPGGIYRYFERMPGVSEDFSFCARAEVAGHPAQVDFGCLVGHEGTKVYWNS